MNCMMRFFSVLLVSAMLTSPIAATAKTPSIKRSAKAKRQFRRENPCPSTGRTSGECSGYVIDHMKPLACGGVDTPSNMRWQTVAEAKEKDKVERIGCK